MTQGLSDYLQQRVAEIETGQGGRAAAPGGAAAGRGNPGGEAAAPETASASPPDSNPDADGVVDAELVDEPDADAVWAEIVQVAASRGLGRLPDLEVDVSTFLGGTSSAEASGAELAEYLEDLRKRSAEQVAS